MATSSKTSKRKRGSAKAAAGHPAVTRAAIAVEPVAAEPVEATGMPAPVETLAVPTARPAPSGSIVVLASNCTVRDAAGLKDTLCEHANETTAVGLDVRSLERIDTATMQVLCAFVRDRANRQQKVQWLGHSQALKDAARLLGLAGMLALAPEDSHNNSGAAA